jgi:hypothetical protein
VVAVEHVGKLNRATARPRRGSRPRTVGRPPNQPSAERYSRSRRSSDISVTVNAPSSTKRAQPAQQAGSAQPDSTATIVSSAGSATARSAMRRSVATCVALLWNHRSSRNASQMRCGSTSRNCMRVLRCRARLADRHGTRLANSKGSLVKSPHRILSFARCVVSIRSSTCCAVVIALRMQTRATANGTDGKHAVRQHLALCDDGGDERQRGPRATRKALVDLGQHRRRHHRHLVTQHLEHGLESFCRAPAREVDD